MKDDAYAFLDFYVCYQKGAIAIRSRELIYPRIGETPPVWHPQRTLNVDHPQGFWQGGIKPELERKVGNQLLPNAIVKKKPIRPIPHQLEGAGIITLPLPEKDYAE